jgi:hypothetical protein
MAGGLEELLGQAEEGLSAVTIAKRSSASYRQVLELLGELERAGKVRRVGVRQTTLWRLISDEEWIARRTSELERIAAASSGSSGEQV